MFNKDVEFLVLLRFLEKENYYEWVPPYLSQPKPKSNILHFMGNFKYLNKQLKGKPYPMPKINEMFSNHKF